MTKKKEQYSQAVSKEDEERLITLSKEALSDSLHDIDGETLSKLRQARENALEQLDKKPSLFQSQWAPIGGFAMAASLTAVVVFMVPDSNQIGEPTNNLSHNTNEQQLREDRSLDVSETLVESQLLAANEPWEEDADMLDDLDLLTWLVIEEEFAG